MSQKFKHLPDIIKFLHSLISTSIKEGDCSDECDCFSRHYANGSSQIQCVGFYQSYIPVAHVDSFRINIAMAAINRRTAMVLDVSNEFHDKQFPIYERVCVIPPPYYLE